MRRIALAAGAEVAGQVNLALEAMAPFALDQMFHGHVVDSAGRHALIYAAYRRNFTAGEQASWNEARAVLPAFLLWAVCGRSPAGRSALVRAHAAGLEAVVWDDASELPAAVLSRGIPAGADEAALLAEAARLAGIPPAQVRQIKGEIAVERLEKGGLSLAAGPTFAGMLPAATLATADVRDRQVQVAQTRRAARTRVLWRIFATTTAALALCLVLEGVLAGGHLLLAGRQRALAAHAPEVSRIEAAQTLATRLESLSTQQLKPFEMLAAVNGPRPRTVAFLRVSTTGPLQIEVEAQTGNAGDMRVYETTLRQMPSVQQVELRDPRMRGGLTTFLLAVTFKPDWLKAGGGS
ncbi:MAG: hypothetical protein ACHQ4G_06780 [Opitutales bacterium]